MNKFFKKISIPNYLYAILIFIGYINYFSYYSFFGINIIDYLTFGELLLSFLNITIPLIVLCTLLLFFEIITEVDFFSKSKDSIKVDRKLIFYQNADLFMDFINSIKSVFEEKKWNSKTTYLNLIFPVLKFIVSLFFFLFFTLYPIELLAHIFGGVFIYSTNIITLSVAGILWFFIYSEKLENLYKDSEVRSAISNLSIFLIFIGFLTFINRLKAENILENKKSAYVEFIFDNKEIKTDSTNLYIGQTQEYLFLRDLNENATIIYPKSKINKLKFIKK